MILFPLSEVSRDRDRSVFALFSFLSLSSSTILPNHYDDDNSVLRHSLMSLSHRLDTHLFTCMPVTWETSSHLGYIGTETHDREGGLTSNMRVRLFVAPISVLRVIMHFFSSFPFFLIACFIIVCNKGYKFTMIR